MALTPQYLDSIEFNRVVELYDQLNMEIVISIIERILSYGDLTETTRQQLKILIQTDSKEVFKDTLLRTSALNNEVKIALAEIYEKAVKENMQGYKHLYDYRGAEFIISESQYKIINQALVQADDILKNFTGTIAFNSQRAYVESVDNAFIKVASGAFSYQEAIDSSIQELARQGITLQDRAGRNVQLEVAVRRNVLGGIQEMANNINRDIEEELECDGYEVTAHTGSRPTHAEAQGKQYALTKEDARKFGVGLWSDVEDLWKEANCRHSYVGIILGISKPAYNKKELKTMNNKKVTLNGEEVPYYEATQKARQIENNIRKSKREVEILKRTGQDYTEANIKLRKYQKQYTQFSNETGIEKDYTRTKVAKI